MDQMDTEERIHNALLSPVVIHTHSQCQLSPCATGYPANPANCFQFGSGSSQILAGITLTHHPYIIYQNQKLVPRLI